MTAKNSRMNISLVRNENMKQPTFGDLFIQTRNQIPTLTHYRKATNDFYFAIHENVDVEKANISVFHNATSLVQIKFCYIFSYTFVTLNYFMHLADIRNLRNNTFQYFVIRCIYFCNSSLRQSSCNTRLEYMRRH